MNELLSQKNKYKYSLAKNSLDNLLLRVLIVNLNLIINKMSSHLELTYIVAFISHCGKIETYIIYFIREIKAE